MTRTNMNKHFKIFIEAIGAALLIFIAFILMIIVLGFVGWIVIHCMIYSDSIFGNPIPGFAFVLSIVGFFMYLIYAYKRKS